ncbi:MAG: oligoendopeptidase F [Gammaproteobacteria bacterium]|nr:oligoendopeptidase F [Gammaproteobacteria bacterium]MDH3491314.1 oligoendopeptidase F [Gammaproteobacteria bacterium]MDH3577846.1 oligoendopeptidase F [Gammaproteobacteria bacterium]
MHKLLLPLAAAMVLFAAHNLAAQQTDEADPQATWDLTDLYPSVEAWSKARDEVMADFAKIDGMRGSLGKSADSLYTTYRFVSDTFRKAGRVYVYASLDADEDLRESETQERRQLADIMFARFGEVTAWMQPELIEVGRETIESFIKEDERLAAFAYQLDDSLRNAAHTLSPETEQTLSYFSQTFGAPNDTYSLLANSDIPWPTIALSDGEEIVVDSQGYGKARSSANRDDRKLVFDAFWNKWAEYRSSVGMVLNSHLQTQVALAKARHYDSVLDRELFQDNLPPAVYRTLVTEVNKALPTLHRYFRLRTRMLGLEQMHYYDIYPPLVSLNREFDLETSKKITLDAMSVLGDDWVSLQKDAMDDRWMHVYPRRGKRSGAYMAGFAYDVHPYLLLNHNDDYSSLSTFAHEWGHAMHTVYAKQAQPFETAGYATFIAEIPSTSLELILQDYMSKNAETINEKLFYLGHALEGMRGTFFRQTMFAEFELALYEAAERGEALSGDRITEMYGEILRRYHGHDEGIVVIDDLYTNEWMYIPHFYLNMYVFQYATSQTAGTALYEKIVDEGEAGVENYKNLLRAGGSDYPYKLLVNAGVDLAKPEPYKAIVKKMNAVMDEMERLLDEKSD